MNYKNIIFIIIIVLVVGFFLLRDTQGENTNDLAFDLDITSLSYSLPSYTQACLPEKKQYCTSGGSCENIKPAVFLLYDEINSMIYRCDDKPCDSYEMNKTESGLYTILEPIIPRGFTVKISSDDSYVETASIGLDQFISYGACR